MEKKKKEKKKWKNRQTNKNNRATSGYLFWGLSLAQVPFLKKMLALDIEFQQES